MIFTLTAPIIKKVSAFKRGGFALLLLGASFAFLFPRYITGLEISLGSYGWFILGMAVASLKLADCQLPKICSFMLAMVFGAMAILEVGSRLMALIGMLTFWFGYDVKPQLFSKARHIVGDQFWTYCFHIVPCSWYVAAMLYIFGKSDLSTVFIFVTCPFVAIVVTYVASFLFRRYATRFYGILIGGRS